MLLPFGLLLLNLLRAFIFTTGGTGIWGPLSLFRLFVFALFFFAFAFERKRPKTFIWVILGGGMLRMLLGVATIVLPLSMRQPEGYKAYALQFAAIFILAQAVETWFAVQRVNRL